MAMNKKETTQLFVVILVVAAYVYLVMTGKAAVEGFAVTAMYILKKFLDMVEVKPEAK